MKEEEYELSELIGIPRGELLKLKEINRDLLEVCKLAIEAFTPTRTGFDVDWHKMEKLQFKSKQVALAIRERNKK